MDEMGNIKDFTKADSTKSQTELLEKVSEKLDEIKDLLATLPQELKQALMDG